MCGITGKISFTDPVTLAHIGKMNEKVRHRGPDDEGVYLSPDRKIGLGHCRLSILDLSPLGHQPMSYLDRYWIVFNGEIYNFQEKRQELEKAGHTFTSRTDTEVVLALYAKYGKDCVLHLRGMFSFAIYDERDQTLFCARDRVGKKPFKYYLDDKAFIFASELKAILTQPEYHQEPDYTAIHHYLTLQYVPAPLTGFAGIKKLEPAHYLLINLKTRKIEKKCYWKLNYSEKWDLSEEEWCRRIIEKLDESVKLRMIADVPLGAFLSGGIDSSAVVALMANNSDRPIKTFSIGFEEEKYNELKYAKMIAEKYGTDHTEFIVKPDALEVLPLLVKHYEEPYADSSALPTYYLSKLTREYVTVALNGDGGDENFAGYSRYSAFQSSLWLEKFVWFNNATLRPATAFLAKQMKHTLAERAERFCRTLSQDFRTRYMTYTSYFTNEQKAQLYREDFKARVWKQDTYDIIARRFSESGSQNRTEQAVYADFATYLPEDLLVKVDIASMMVALEGRSPFLDHEMLELTAKIPFHLKLKGFNNKKYILKKALAGLVPDAILYRPKMGFGVPLAQWFRKDLKGYVYQKLLSDSSHIGKLFRQSYIKELLDAHTQTNISYAPHIWALLTLELWFEEYFP